MNFPPLQAISSEKHSSSFPTHSLQPSRSCKICVTASTLWRSSGEPISSSHSLGTSLSPRLTLQVKSTNTLTRYNTIDLSAVPEWTLIRTKLPFTIAEVQPSERTCSVMIRMQHTNSGCIARNIGAGDGQLDTARALVGNDSCLQPVSALPVFPIVKPRFPPHLCYVL